MIKNGCWCERECQHDAAITHSYKIEVRSLSLDVTLTGGLLIMVGEQSALRDRMVPGEDLHDWCFLYDARILGLSASQLSRKKHTLYLVINGNRGDVSSKILNTCRPHTVYMAAWKKTFPHYQIFPFGVRGKSSFSFSACRDTAGADCLGMQLSHCSEKFF